MGRSGGKEGLYESGDDDLGAVRRKAREARSGVCSAFFPALVPVCIETHERPECPCACTNLPTVQWKSCHSHRSKASLCLSLVRHNEVFLFHSLFGDTSISQSRAEFESEFVAAGLSTCVPLCICGQIPFQRELFPTIFHSNLSSAYVVLLCPSYIVMQSKVRIPSLLKHNIFSPFFSKGQSHFFESHRLHVLSNE